MTYQETLEFLYSQLPAYHRIGNAAYKSDLHNTIALDNLAGNPHLKFRSIHVAGTNGKGSVSHMIASVLQEAGYRTGLYTSPHLKDFRERIRLNGAMIAESEVVTFVTKYKKAIETLKPSFFEMTVAMAFEYFAENEVDIAIVEVGLGGRLDSTNIITPILSVITNIGHDHMDLLGDTLEKIAFEKAGIIKKGIPAVISETQDETKDVFKKKALQTGSSIVFADKSYLCSLEDASDSVIERDYIVKEFEGGQIHKGSTPLGGDYQSKNIQCVYQIFRTLGGIMKVSDSDIKKGIYRVITNTGLSGRWQVLGNSPLTVCDTGHNFEGLEYVMRQIGRIRKSGLHIVIGFVNDKDLRSVFPLLPENAEYYFTKASVPRALDENILKKMAEIQGLKGNSFPDVKSAIEAARENASASDMIFIGGSTFIVGDAL